MCASLKSFVLTSDRYIILFSALRNVSQKYSRGSLPPFPSNNERTRYGPVKVSKVSSLLELLHVLRDPMGVIERDQPVPMESIGQVHTLSYV